MQMWRVATLAVTAAVAVLAIACSDDEGGGDADDVESTIQTAVEAFSAGDAQAFADIFTDKGILELFGGGPPGEGPSAEEARAELVASADEFSLEFRDIDNTEVEGDTATTDVTVETDNVIEGSTFSLIKEGEEWKIDGYDGYSVSPDVPDDYKTVDLAVQEFSFVFDEAEIETGKVAFAVENVGQQPHEVVLVSLAEGVVLEEALESDEEEPAGIGFLGRIEMNDTGDEYNMVLVDDVAAGRYALVCFFPDTDDPEGTPHAFKGMATEFTIE